MAKLVKAVFVRDPDRHGTVLLHPGEEPEPRIAALVTNPDAWEDGKVPAEAEQASGDDSKSSDEDSDTAAPAAKKTAARKTAATGRSRGRDAADEGSSGE